MSVFMADITHIGQLNPDPKNARKHTPRNVGSIVDALHEVGAARSIVIDENNTILAGNATIDAAGQAGIERLRVIDADGDEIIAVRRSGLTAKQKTRLALFDNRAAEHAEWDTDVLADLQQEGDVLDGLFYDDELAELLASVGTPVVGGGGDEFDTTPSEGPTRVQSGDVWRIGEHRIGCLDSADPQAVVRLLQGVKPNMVWADPPYGMNLDTDFDGMFSGDKSHRKTGARFKPVEGDDKDYDPSFLMAYFSDVREQVWWGADYYADKIPNLTSGTFVVWDKRCSPEMDKVVGNVYELAWSKQSRRKEIVRLLWSGHHGMQGDTRKRVHPTQKPVALVEWFLERVGRSGDLIFDPYLGSGPSIIAAERNGRKVYGCELSPAYCDVILRRAEAEGIGPIELVGNIG